MGAWRRDICDVQVSNHIGKLKKYRHLINDHLLFAIDFSGTRRAGSAGNMSPCENRYSKISD